MERRTPRSCQWQYFWGMDNWTSGAITSTVSLGNTLLNIGNLVSVASSIIQQHVHKCSGDILHYQEESLTHRNIFQPSWRLEWKILDLKNHRCGCSKWISGACVRLGFYISVFKNVLWLGDLYIWIAYGKIFLSEKVRWCICGLPVISELLSSK